MANYFTRRGERPLPINVDGIVTNPSTGLPYDYFQKDTTTPYPGWTSPWPSVGTFNEYAKEFPVWQEGAFTGISPPSRNAGFSFPPGEKNVKGPWGAMGQTWREAPGEPARPEPLNPQQVAVSNEIISRGHDPQHIYDIYSATTKVDAAGQPVLPLERVHSQKQQDLAGRIINESIASARETRPELFTEPAASGEAILPPPSVSNEILPQPPERPLPPLQQTRFSRFPSDPFMRYQDSTQDMLGGTGMHPSHGLLGKAETQIYPEVSGEQAAAVPIDPADLVGGSFFSGPNQTGELVNPGKGFRFSDNVLKGAAGGPFSEMRALAREDAPWQKFVGPAMTAVGGSQIPGAGLLGLFAAGLNKLGAYDQFNPATDSNLFADPETGRATWGTTDPGGSGSQRGTLNLYNMLQDFGGSYPNRQVQTPSRRINPEDGPSYEIPQYANARDLAYIMGQGDRPPPGLYTQQTPLGYQDFGEDSNVTNQEALRDYAATGSGAILNEAGAILGPDAGYNETRDLAASMAEDLQGQMDFAQSDIAPGYSGEDWGYW